MPGLDVTRTWSKMAWAVVDKVGCRMLQFAFSVVVARLLMPADYGLVGMLALFAGLSGIIVNAGFSSALIRVSNRQSSDYATAFWFNVATAAALYLLLFTCAPMVAGFYGEPRVAAVMRVLCLQVVVDALALVPGAILATRLEFRALSCSNLGAVLLSGITSLVLAVRGWGVWALVAQVLAYAVARLGFLGWVAHWHPAAVFSWEAFVRLFGFGWKVLASELINATYGHLHSLVIGKRFSAADVGFYLRGSSFAALPGEAVTQAVVSVHYPILAEMENDVASLRAAYARLVRWATWMLVPALALLVVFAPQIVRLLLGEKWLPCVPYLRILACAAVWEPLTHINLNLLYVKGRSDLLLKLEIWKKSIAFALLFASMPFGIVWMCVGRAVFGLIAYVFDTYYMGKFLGFGLRRQLRTMLFLP